MINAVLNFSVRQRMIVILAALMLTGFGFLAVKQIPIDAFPDVTNVQVQVLSTAGGMSPPEVEKLVTRPIEIQMGGLPRLTEIRSVSKIGLSAITVVFEDGVNDYFARQLVSERLASVRENLPAGVDVELGPITTGLGEIFQYTLVSDEPKKYDATELRTVQDYIVRPLLRSVPGVTDVNSFGGLVKQYQVIIKPERLTSFKVTLQQVFEALEKNNANASGNYIEHQSEQFVVRGLGLVKDTRDIENIIVATQEHSPIYVRDVADVKIGSELRQGAVTMNAKGEAVAGIVMMLKGASGRDVVNAVKAKAARDSEGATERRATGSVLRPDGSGEEGDSYRHQSIGRRSDLHSHHFGRASGRRAQRDCRHSRPAPVSAVRLHHDEMVWP